VAREDHWLRVSGQALRLRSARSLIGDEEEGLVLLYGTAQCPAVLVLVKDVGLMEEVRSVERCIAEELERITVESVGSGLDDSVQDTAGVAAVFGIDGVGYEIELLNRIGAGDDDGSVDGDVIGIRAIYEERVLLRLASIARVRIPPAYRAKSIAAC